MLLVNSQRIEPSSARPERAGKFILNESAIIFFSASAQHNSVKLRGLSDEYDYGGNALAGSFAICRIDLRFHRNFSDEHLRTIWSRIRAQSELAFLKGWSAFYQGRKP
jgi:hypothetical protein